MYGLQLLVELLVCHGVVFAGVGKNRYAFALGICNKFGVCTFFCLNYSVAVVDSKLAKFHKVEVVLVC